jgi:hypothetical protein
MKKLITMTMAAVVFGMLAQTASASVTLQVPETGSTAPLLMGGVGALIFGFRMFKRNK